MECGRGAEEVEEMLEREVKKPVTLRLSGAPLAAALGATGAEDGAGDVDGGLAAAAAEAFHSLKPQREAPTGVPEVFGAADGAGADCAVWAGGRAPGGCIPMLFSSMNVRRARTQVSEAS